jgi:hypothetical protein
LIFEAVLGLGSFGLGLFGLSQSRKAYKRQEQHYNQQEEMNRQIGAFNAQVAERVGAENAAAIAMQTKRTLGEQRVEFARRGVSMEGSPMFVMGETMTMGAKQVQQAYFDGQVNKINAQFNAYTASSHDMARADNARF